MAVLHRIAGAPLDYAALRQQLAVPGDFPSAVLAEAERAARSADLPDADATDLPLVTIDPAGSLDLDQAVHLAREGSGYVVHYAIADLAAFVAPGSALDAEAWRRGETLYFPDARVPLHPPVIGEGAASLLPGAIRPAALWRITLDADGSPVDVDVHRARVRSTARLDYVGVQRDLDAGVAADAIALLPEIGAKRIALARARHAINLDLPAQEVESGPDGWRVVLREPLAVEDDNAEISLLTGMCAAQLMLDGRSGVLRTLPDPDDAVVRRLRRAAHALGVAWSESELPGDVIARLDRTDPKQVALLGQAARLLRGAGYQVFAGTVPEHTGHAGIGAPYAHVTAPIRRLVDRYATEICLALQARTPVPAWVGERLHDLPAAMRAADQRAHEADRAVIDMTEAWLLRDRIGTDFDAAVLDADEHGGTIALDDPVVRAHCDGADLPVGQRIRVRLVTADVTTREVRFARV